jgi:seryl-tRNA synthetase
LKTRHSPVDVSAVLELDERRRAAITEVDRTQGRPQRNFQEDRRAEESRPGHAEIQRHTREMGEKISALDAHARDRGISSASSCSAIPNMPHESVPRGEDAIGQRRRARMGPTKRPSISNPRTTSRWARRWACSISSARPAVGCGFPQFIGLGARLERALIQFMLNLPRREARLHRDRAALRRDHATMTRHRPIAQDGRGHVPRRSRRPLADSDREVPVTNIHREENHPRAAAA